MPLVNSPAQKTLLKWASSIQREEARHRSGCAGPVPLWATELEAHKRHLIPFHERHNPFVIDAHTNYVKLYLKAELSKIKNP